MRYQPGRELLDADEGTAEEVAESLNDLWWLNRRLGGLSTNQKLFSAVLQHHWAPEYSILDVGAGTGHVAAALRDWLADQHIAARVFVLDRQFSHLRHGDPIGFGLTPVVADVLAPPFAGGSFDVVTCSLFLHHFSGERAVALLRDLHGLARIAVVINDLERALVPYLFMRAISPWAKSRLTRHDAPLSFHQAYIAEELRQLARSAGFSHFEVRRLRPYRLGLVVWKES